MSDNLGEVSKKYEAATEVNKAVLSSLPDMVRVLEAASTLANGKRKYQLHGVSESVCRRITAMLEQRPSVTRIEALPEEKVQRLKGGTGLVVVSKTANEEQLGYLNLVSDGDTTLLRFGIRGRSTNETEMAVDLKLEPDKTLELLSLSSGKSIIEKTRAEIKTNNPAFSDLQQVMLFARKTFATML